MEDERVGVERVRLPAGEVPALVTTHHTLGLNLGSSRTVQYSVGARWQTVEIAPGAASFFPAGTRVAARWTQDSEIAMISMDPHWLRNALGDQEDPLAGRVALIIADRALEAHARRLLDEAAADQLGRELAVPALGSLLAVDIARHLQHVGSAGVEHLTPRQVRRLTEKIRSDLSGILTLENLAAEAGLSLYHFARAFKRTLGITPADFVRRERVRQAAELLRRTRIPMQEIGRMTGFASPSHFAQTFRRYRGSTPSEYRHTIRRQARESGAGA